ncbi:MAG: Gfo/Idh/MocA family oxidoreductase [Acutalibacter sp.]|nr:Gfo/Idh/MocA family oxidoreductase [Acutalibacter sp.]
MKAPITFAIAGFGDRGSTYASMQELFPDKMKVVAVADLNPVKVEKAKKLYHIPEENCFSSAEEMLEREKLADVMVVSTMDRQHVGHAIPALKKGYHILMEKPISPELSKCREILEVAKDCPGKIIVGHVLRYTVFYNTLKDLISGGRIGDVVSICANENVGYWHQAHSFVRGNWRNSQETSPMILQKSCHDMDILTWILGKRCKSVSSFGSTHLFKKECAPEGATPYCLGGCKAKESCVFDAEKIYVTSPKTGIQSHSGNWITSILSVDNTVESTYEALRSGPYGRCVYFCDNDVVDHQQTNLLMEDGSTISFTMCAFTESCYRYFKAMGTKGEIEADMQSNVIHIREFGKPEEVIDVGNIASDLKGHGGGDSGIVADFLEMLLNDRDATERTTTLENSMESHFIALAAEESRVNGGKVVDLASFKNGK